MAIVLYVSGFILLFLSVKLIRKTGKNERELLKYEFKIRSDGGILKFDSYEDSEEHLRKKRRVGNLYLLGGLLVLISLIILAVAYIGY